MCCKDPPTAPDRGAKAWTWGRGLGSSSDFAPPLLSSQSCGARRVSGARSFSGLAVRDPSSSLYSGEAGSSCSSKRGARAGAGSVACCCRPRNSSSQSKSDKAERCVWLLLPPLIRAVRRSAPTSFATSDGSQEDVAPCNGDNFLGIVAGAR